MQLPEGSRCELCGQCGPADYMGFVSREFDAQDEEFKQRTANMPERFKPKTGRHRLAVWAHIDGNGCSAQATPHD